MKDIIDIFITISLGIVLIVVILSYEKETKCYENIIQNQKDSISYLTKEVTQIKFDFKNYKDSINVNDTIIYENFILKYKINRIKQYDSIVIRNSSQNKYFRGWVRRVIYDY